MVNEFSWLTRNINHVWWKQYILFSIDKVSGNLDLEHKLNLTELFILVVFNLCQFTEWTKESTTLPTSDSTEKACVSLPKRHRKLSNEPSVWSPEAKLPGHHSKSFWIKRRTQGSLQQHLWALAAWGPFQLWMYSTLLMEGSLENRLVGFKSPL